LAGLWVVSLFAPSSFCIIPKMSGKLANGFLKLSSALTLQADPLVTGNDVSAIEAVSSPALDHDIWVPVLQVFPSLAC
jgi:hypothetical protein